MFHNLFLNYHSPDELNGANISSVLLFVARINFAWNFTWVGKVIEFIHLIYFHFWKIVKMQCVRYINASMKVEPQSIYENLVYSPKKITNTTFW